MITLEVSDNVMLYSTDVLVLVIHYMPHFENMEEMYLYTGPKTKTTDYRRFIPI